MPLGPRGLPLVPGTLDALVARAPPTKSCCGLAARDRLPGDGQGGRGRWRQGYAARAHARGTARCGACVTFGGRLGLWRWRCLLRALAAPAAARGSAGARRPARDRAALRGAGMLGPAPPPEAGRRDTVAGRVAGAAHRDHARGRHAGGVGGLHERRHRGISPRRGRAFLLPRDEHQAPGGAPDHGDGDGDRSGAVADSAGAG